MNPSVGGVLGSQYMNTYNVNPHLVPNKPKSKQVYSSVNSIMKGQKGYKAKTSVRRGRAPPASLPPCLPPSES